MSRGSRVHGRAHLDAVCLYALQALPASDLPSVESQLSTCAECRRELETLRPVVGAFIGWPTDLLRPSTSLWERLARRLATETGQEPEPAAPPEPGREWDEVAPGLSCLVLATDPEARRVSMLVRLAPGAEYPPHTHAGVEEVHMLQGVLVVDETTLHPGDYLRSEPGSTDHRVWSESGCTCVLITSTRDALH